MDAKELAEQPEGSTVTVGHKTFTKRWSGAWERYGVFLSSEALAELITATTR